MVIYIYLLTIKNKRESNKSSIRITSNDRWVTHAHLSEDQ